jgi:hypothetical protein
MSRQRRDYRALIFDKPFDLIDGLFQTERRSLCGVAIILFGFALMLYMRAGPSEAKGIVIVNICAWFTLAASFFNEGTARTVVGMMFIGALTIFLIAST